jgi:ketosteroid isomerase-like protein
MNEDPNVERARQVLEAWNRRDLEAVLALAARDIEYRNSPLAVEPGTRHGRTEYEAVLRAQWEVLGDTQLAIEALQAAGASVFATVRLSRTMPGGGERRMQAQIGIRFTFGEGGLVRQEIVPAEQWSDALAAAGLSPL